MQKPFPTALLSRLPSAHQCGLGDGSWAPGWVPTTPGRMEISSEQVLHFQVKALRLDEVGNRKILSNFLSLTTFKLDGIDYFSDEAYLEYADNTEA